MIRTLLFLFAAAALAGAQEPPPAPPSKANLPSVDGLFAALRGGAWRHDEFEAVTLNGLRTVRAGTLGEAGLDLGTYHGPWAVFSTLDYASSDDLRLWIAGAHLGRSFPLALDQEMADPFWLRLSAGVIAGTFKVRDDDFGDFDEAAGWQVRASLMKEIPGGLTLSLWGDYRDIEFHFDEDRLAGDRSAIGPSTAFGAGLGIRF